MVAKIKISKIPEGFQRNSRKSLDQNYPPKKSHTGFPSLENFQKAFLINNNGAFAAGITGTINKLKIVLDTPKIPFLNQATE